tara:strand:+ start:39 stop:803 length:765 start_codon:yes stop_codon:yes gene_type:complete
MHISTHGIVASSAGGATPAFTNTLSTLFDGTDDYVNCGDNNNLSFGDGSTDSPFSISLWVKLSGTTFIEAPISKYGVDSTREYMIYIVNQKVRLLINDVSTSGVRIVETSSAISVGSWVHITATYNGVGGANAQNGMKIYIDGIIATTSDTIIGTYVAMENTSQPVEIGRYFNGVQYLAGNTDEVSVFNSELSASDITSIYNSGTPNDISAISGLVSWWRMGDGDTYPTITDNAGSNDGLMKNMSSANFVADVP